MSRPHGATRPAALFALALSAAIAACNDPFALPPATFPPLEGTLTLYALTGTPLDQPSAYNMLVAASSNALAGGLTRTDRTFQFDFALDLPDSLHDTIPVLIPPGALGLPRDGGVQVTKVPYDSITVAPDGGYEQATAVPVAVGTVVLVSSRSQSCNFGYIRPLYAKLKITAIDLKARTVTFQMLLNPDCGYRSLRHSLVPPTE